MSDKNVGTSAQSPRNLSRIALYAALVAVIFLGAVALTHFAFALIDRDYWRAVWAAVAYSGWLIAAVAIVAELAGWRRG